MYGRCRYEAPTRRLHPLHRLPATPSVVLLFRLHLLLPCCHRHFPVAGRADMAKEPINLLLPRLYVRRVIRCPSVSLFFLAREYTLYGSDVRVFDIVTPADILGETKKTPCFAHVPIN